MARMVPIIALVASHLFGVLSFGDEGWPGYVETGYKAEQAREIRFSEDCRAIILAPPAAPFDPAKPTLLVMFATPNGNTAEQTLGCQLTEGLDWHFDIQNIAAQWRVFRTFESSRNVVLACVQANNLSWPAWKDKRPHGPEYIRQIVERVALTLPANDVYIALTGHSGGGSFIFGYIDACEKIPNMIERIAFLDANYGYNSARGHGEKVLQWLTDGESRHFAVLAYDDRNIMVNDKKIVGPTGGTYRATSRMLEFLRGETAVTEDRQEEFTRYAAVNGRLVALVHPNPENIILHTRLVGEMNGLLELLTIGTPYHDQWGKLAPSRAYFDQIQQEPVRPGQWHPHGPTLPPRHVGAEGGSAIVQSNLNTEPSVREEAIVKEILSGNVPDFWRHFVEVSAQLTTDDGKSHNVIYRVAPDYLVVGSDEDFVRMPLTPYLAQNVADILGCVLPTRKMVNDIHQSADVKLDPLPLTQARESLATFLKHHRLIEQTWQGLPRQRLVAGSKKDIVVTNRLLERPGRVAIYGWHKEDGKPIQPLTTVHVDRYVDYSHGVRLIDQWCRVDGQPRLIEEVCQDESLWPLLSDEGPLKATKYLRTSFKP